MQKATPRASSFKAVLAQVPTHHKPPPPTSTFCCSRTKMISKNFVCLSFAATGCADEALLTLASPEFRSSLRETLRKTGEIWTRRQVSSPNTSHRSGLCTDQITVTITSLYTSGHCTYQVTTYRSGHFTYQDTVQISSLYGSDHYTDHRSFRLI